MDMNNGGGIVWGSGRCWVEKDKGEKIRTTAIRKSIKYNFKKDTNGIFHWSRTNISKMYMESKMTPNRLSNLEKEQSRRDHDTWYQTILQGHCYQKSLVLVLEQTHRQMKQNREPRNKPKCLWSINIWQSWHEYTME